MKVKAKFDILPEDPRNFSHELIRAGQEMTVFLGNTYGCVEGFYGTALTFSDDPYEGPFFELPRSYVTVDGKDSF